MEIHKGIDDPIRGERIVAVEPPLIPDGQSGWKRRLNLYSGRSLSASALETEQSGRAGRLTTRSQSVSPGIVMGLEIELEALPPAAEDGLTAAFLSLAPGYAIAASGEDVLIPSARHIAVGGLPVSGVELEGMLPTFANLRDQGLLGDLSPIGVLRLRPVILPTAGEFDEFDPCIEDEGDAAYEDQQLADAAILEYVPLSAAFFDGTPPVLEGTSLVDVNRWRNRIAYAIFARDSATVPPDLLDWEAEGIAIGLIAFAADWTPLFVDRASVVRAGGKPMRRTRLQAQRGSSFLWQARMEQLAEQLANPQLDGIATPATGAMFNFLPPTGIIPADALNLGAEVAQNRFFPAHFGVDAVPVSLDQLDVAFEASAALDPYDTTVTDYVRMLVPVPAHLYEPRLLLQESIDPIFAETINAFKVRRNELLGRRAEVRAINAAYLTVIDGKAPEFPDDAASDDEEPAESPFDPSEESYETTKDEAGTLTVPAFEQLHSDLVKLIQEANVNAEAEDGLNLRRDGLKSYISRLKQAANAADDNIDIGFLRVQTDIYRVRQLVMGKEIASKLVTSPALASIVTDEQSSYATREALRDYLVNAKDTSPAIDRDAPPPGPTAFTPAIELAQPINRATIFNLLDRARVESEPSHTFEFIRPKEVPPVAIEAQSPIVGATAQLRDTTIGQRIERSGAVDAKDNTRATQLEIVTNLSTSPIFADLEVPVVNGYEGMLVKYENVRVQDLVADPGRILNVNQPGEDEIAYFNAGIDVIDVSVAALRAAEARVKRFRDAIALAEAALKRLESTLQQVNNRLSVLGDELAEARHDVSVAEALRDEEQARIDAINARRRQILRAEVKFLAYIRPRTTETIIATPIRVLDPGYTPAAVPACLRASQSVPPELRALVDLFRDVPIRWLVQMPKVLNRLDRIELLQEVMLTGITRAKTPARSHAVLFQNSSFSSNLGQAIARTYTAHQQTATAFRNALAEFDPLTLRGRTWKQVRDVTAENASLDDLVEAGHGKSDVAQQALRELDDMAQVAACLYARFGDVRPVLRLRWAETLSQYDEPVNLRNLANLEKFGEVEILERRQMQQLVDWLHNAVESSAPQAVAMVNDLIRVCLLLASHAPVNQLITASVAQPAPVLPGKPLILNVDFSRVKIGMNVFLYDRDDRNKVVAQAVIDDLAASTATARVVTATRANLQVDKNTPVVITAAQEMTQAVFMPMLSLR